MLARAFSIRVIFLSLVVGVCGGVLIQLVWASVPLMPVVWIVAAGCYAMALFNDGQMIRCDSCRKRVKMGAERCHHCGYVRA